MTILKKETKLYHKTFDDLKKSKKIKTFFANKIKKKNLDSCSKKWKKNLNRLHYHKNTQINTF